ncbi:PA0069 family radical SAM protein [Polyangium sp. 6x1]|uniref:PA0069 family radical SAM protein n=1 Tax=Polyangium sp. 6x1 TaxID=3042689 RepID=UPI002482213D|nr:PA0069 family radical SAM protein [Polyangium sp. 6x1]MDI1445754.1 PA0069 family radical SAM protein [Polyangium sp. 6x1]
MPRPVQNPPNPWAKTEVEWLDEPPNATLQVFEEQARSILSENESPDLPFRFSLNPYRGCIHACAYCYARPSHQYLGFGAGTDFDRKIVVKMNAPRLLREAFEKPSWRGDGIVLSGNTDCYQALEASYELTRQCLEVCLAFQNPVSIITKSRLVARDADLLSELSRRARAHVFLSIPFARDEDGRKIEPWASKTSLRFGAMRALADAGVPVGIAVAPVIPGLNDADIAELLERAREAGAEAAFLQPLRLSAEVLPVFEERLAEAYPLRAQKVRNAIQEMRGGKMNESAFGARFSGLGPRWAMIERMFEAHCARLGLNRQRLTREEPTTFQRPKRQLSLFDDGSQNR